MFVCVLFVCRIGSGFWRLSIFVAFSHKDRSYECAYYQNHIREILKSKKLAIEVDCHFFTL